jgi:hypothetical protein
MPGSARMPLFKNPLPCTAWVSSAPVPGGWLGSAPSGSRISGGGAGGNGRAAIAST